MLQLPKRLQSIDVFRALTMFLMIFVNDVDGVINIPQWIKHVDEHTDGLGFADTIFPAFLFIVGLSIPFALNKRMQTGESRFKTALHIALRSFALIVMGFFHVNLESYSDSALLPEPVFEILITIAFFLIWLDYKPGFNKSRQYILQAAGIIILIIMALLFKGEDNGHVVGLRTYWWGILGLIGWAYFTCAFIYLFSNGRLFILVTALILFLFLDVMSHATSTAIVSAIQNVWMVGDGSMASLTMAGVVISVLYTQLVKQNKTGLLRSIMFFSAVGMIVFGFLTRPFGGISKINDTPAWIGICTGISILVFSFLVFIVDIKGKAKWFNIIKPAGTSTLTCYLIPYFLYSFYELLNIEFPDFFNEGIGGILRSFATAFIVIFIAGWLEKKHIRLSV